MSTNQPNNAPTPAPTPAPPVPTPTPPSSTPAPTKRRFWQFWRTNNSPTNPATPTIPNPNRTTRRRRRPSIPMSPEAEQLALDLSAEVTESLSLQATYFARKDHASLVQPSHVQDGWRIVRRGNPSDWLSKALLLAAGAFLGIGCPGIVGELGFLPAPRPIFIIIHVTSIVIGICAGFVSIYRDKS